jgi:hypothetical protein
MISSGSGQQVTGPVNGPVYQLKDIGGDVTFLQNRPFYRLERLASQPARLSAEDARAQPSRMLHARYEVVPFVGRSDLLGRLTEWLEEAAAVSVRLVHGPGGQGKSRLAAHFAREHADRWMVWQARHDLVPSRGPGRPTGPDTAAGLLVIADYADRWALRDLEALIADLRTYARGLPGSHPLRFLLLARSAGSWWAALKDDLEAGYDIRSQAINLPMLGEDIDRAELFAAAREWFTARMDIGEVGRIPVPAELSRPTFGRVLTIHMAALADVDARQRGTIPPRDPERISAYLLRRERAQWHKLQADALTVTSARDMGRAVYAATLTGPLPRSQGIEVLGRVRVASQTEANHILDDHQRCYPPLASGTVLEPLYPDRLGEDFLALTTPGGEHGSDLGYEDDWADDVIPGLLAPDPDRQQFPPYAGHAVTILVETARRWPHIRRDQLYPLLHRSPSLAVDAGVATLYRVMGMDDVDPDVLTKIDSCLTDPDGELDVELHPAAAELAERVFMLRLDQAADSGARGAAYADFGRKLGYAGEHERALAQTTAAVDIYRESGASVDLAMALTQMAWQLLEVKQPDPERGKANAEEAIAMWRDLPGGEQARPKDAAESFNSLGSALSDLGEDKNESARAAYESALRLREQHHRQLPDERRRQDPLVAASLLNIGLTFQKTAQWSEARSFAERSVHAYRAAIEAGHRGGGRVGLMRAIEALATAQWELGQRADAIKNSRESAERALVLARASPVAQSGELASRLSGIRRRLSAVGRIDDALSLTEEVIQFYRGAADGRRATEAISHVGAFLGELGRHEEAMPFTHAAVAACQRKVEAGEPGSQADLATALSRLSEHLWELGRAKEGRAAAGQAAQAWRQMPEPDRAAGLHELGSGLFVTLEEYGEALAVTAEAVQIYRRLANREPGKYEEELAGALEDLSSRQKSLGRCGDACTTASEATNIYRKLSGQKSENRASLARSLCARAANLSELERHSQGLAALEEAAEIYRSLAVTQVVHRLSLAQTLLELAWCLEHGDHREQASLCSDEAMGIYRQYAESNEPGFWFEVADSWLNQSWRMEQQGRQSEALPITRDAIALYGHLNAADPALEADYFYALICLARQSLKLNLQDEARKACAQAVDRCQQLAPRHLPRRLADLVAIRRGELLEIIIHLGLEEEATRARAIIAAS